ncbi:MAG: hypothetical protein MK212_15160 [Saprospiraceae bacterium]|nr:hypothetical protein [Saprospiraceae bacterium]
MFLKSLLLSLTMCLVVQMTFAQGSSDISIIDGNVILKTNDLTGYGNLSPEDFLEMDSTAIDSLFSSRSTNVTVHLHLSDTTFVQNIYLKLGRTSGASDISNLSFGLDGSNLPSTITLSRDGLRVYLDLGDVYNMSVYFMEAWLEDDTGTLSTIFVRSNP